MSDARGAEPFSAMALRSMPPPSHASPGGCRFGLIFAAYLLTTRCVQWCVVAQRSAQRALSCSSPPAQPLCAGAREHNSFRQREW
eukprot:2218491-Prymnesium_polylepis.1